jgi:hypothetical protein
MKYWIAFTDFIEIKSWSDVKDFTLQMGVLAGLLTIASLLS